LQAVSRTEGFGIPRFGAISGLQLPLLPHLITESRRAAQLIRCRKPLPEFEPEEDARWSSSRDSNAATGTHAPGKRGDETPRSLFALEA